MIGRMTAGWISGHFVYSNPDEIKQVINEKLLGFIAHYAIGISFALLYVFGWHQVIGSTVSATWVVPYGILTTAVSWFFVFPSMGLGICGLKSPEKFNAAISSLTNHFFYGVGMAIGIALR